MGLELSKHAYELCRERDAPGLRVFLEAHPGVDVSLHEGVDNIAESSNNSVGLAAQHESPECLRVLLDFGVDVNSQDRQGRTPLTHSSAVGRVECMRLLLEKKADLGHQNKNGDTGLHLACQERYVECVRLLIESKADVQLQNEDGETRLILAAWSGQFECLRLMIEANADVDHQEKEGSADLHLACQEGHAECVRLLIESKADVQLQDEHGQTRLLLASWKGQPECLRLMIEAEADISYQLPNGSGALSYAVRFRHMSCFFVLLDHPSDAPASDQAKAIALKKAFEPYGFPLHAQTAVFVLLACGADIKEAIKDRAVPRDHVQSATSCYRNVLGFVDSWHDVAVAALSNDVRVDTRVGRGD